MIEALLGSRDKERVLAYLYCREKGYAREMARSFGSSVAPFQKQLVQLEAAGVLTSEWLGRTRLYRFNPRYPFRKELQALLEKALRFYPEDERQQLLMARQRPRLAGKPL
jgi:predicted transcriptional regulator